MTSHQPLAPAAFAVPDGPYLNTASTGLLPLAAADAATAFAARAARGQGGPEDNFGPVEECRAAFARLAGVPVERVAVGHSVAVHAALIAASLPDGGEVLAAEGEFSSLVNPFAVRPGLRLRTVPLTELAGSVDARTVAVVVSAAQSADGRVADLAALRAAADREGARVVVDATQAMGWLPVPEATYDYLLCGAYKWLMSPHGVSFLVVPAGDTALRPLHAGWVAGEDKWASCYGPIAELARSARRFDERAAFLPYAAGRHALALVEELGVERIAAHDLGLAERFRAGARGLGLEPVEARSPIVSVPGLTDVAKALEAAGVRTAVRAGALRASFHLYNGDADVDRLLEVLADAR